MRDSFERTLSVLLGLSAIAIAVVLVHREFFSPPQLVTSARTSEYVPTWRDVVPLGHLVGDSSARIKITEFADLECPFCSRYNTTLQAVRSTYPHDVATVFVHYPLVNHRFALPAARAAECAGSMGRFGEAVDVLYKKQDSLGLKTWTSFALEAGIRDTGQFAKCVSDKTAMTAVNAGLAAAQKLGINGTPTIILNGWRYGTPPSDSELVRAVADLLAGRAPYSGYPKSVRY